MLSLPILLCALACTARALPSLASRQSSDACAGLGGLHVFDNASNFTLAALNTTLPNANSSGVPLLLGTNPNTSPDTTTVVATFASYPVFWPGPVMLLVNGTLITQPTNGFIGTNANVTEGLPIGFVLNEIPYAQPGPEIFCIQDDGAPSGLQFGVLAVFGDTEGFSLCTSIIDTSPVPTPVNEVVYQATANNSGVYDYESCYPVRLQIIYQ